eukprot:GSMAST32.ASY1.ANO1.2544.1 assembled CDS
MLALLLRCGGPSVTEEGKHHDLPELFNNLEIKTETVEEIAPLGGPELKEYVGQMSTEAAQLNGRGLVEELFDTGLFCVPNVSASHLEPPKCKNPVTRKFALSVLAELAKGCRKNWEQLCVLVAAHHEMPSIEYLEKKEERAPPAYPTGGNANVSVVNSYWEKRSAQDPAIFAQGRSSAGYVGLHNPCCICYMNSTNQQLFMMPRFRKGILAVISNLTAREESVLWQFQRLLAHLQESRLQDFRSDGLCTALQDYDGNPVNVSVQQDSTEYLTSIINRLESSVDAKAVIDDCFRIPMSRLKEADSVKFPGTKLRELGNAPGEGELYLTVDVKGHDTLEASLKQFFDGNEAEFRWHDGEEKEERVKTRLRPFMNKMPRYLMFVLKRFEADWSTVPATMVKHNDELRFPNELNMYNYSLECYLKKQFEAKNENNGDGSLSDDDDKSGTKYSTEHPPEYYQYKLSGIQIHRGAFNSGHYFSYCKTRESENPTSNSNSTWVEFNDSLTQKYDPARIPGDCFGGGRRAQSAYVIVYDRLHSSEWPSRDVQNNADVSKTNENSNLVEDPDKKSGVKEVNNLNTVFAATVAGGFARKLSVANAERRIQQLQRGRVPPAIMTEIMESNMELWKNQVLQDEEYYKFLTSLFSSIASDISSTVMKKSEKSDITSSLELATRVGVSFLFGSFVTSTDTSTREELMPDVLCALKRLLLAPPASSWLLDWLCKNSEVMKYLVFASGSENIVGRSVRVIRQQIAKELIVLAMKTQARAMSSDELASNSALLLPPYPVAKLSVSAVNVNEDFTVTVKIPGTFINVCFIFFKI